MAPAVPQSSASMFACATLHGLEIFATCHDVQTTATGKACALMGIAYARRGGLATAADSRAALTIAVGMAIASKPSANAKQGMKGSVALHTKLSSRR
mmetsp:Transcript_2647/g.6849  ORF Transcript_2647/g.6849 Transcript_2647/m.6849 type:complete len:97 (-) Transcript_2647:1760-2050(-)